MTKRLLRKILISVAIAIALILFVRIAYLAGVYIEKITNHSKVQQLIDQNLTYESDTLDEQLSLALDWVENRSLSDADKGKLYERISLIYQLRGEEMPYYRYLGYALYYLRQSDEKDYTINIYLDLANFYLNNFSYDSAQEMIGSAMNVEPFEAIENLQIKSYAYRIQGMLYTARGEYEAAEDCLKKSLDVVSHSESGGFEEAYVAMAEVWLARVYFETDRRGECGLILSKYEDSPLLTQDFYRQIMLRDFVIPYEETKCLFVVSGIWDKYDDVTSMDMKKELDASAEFVAAFIDVCEETGYQKHELVTLLRIQNDYPAQQIEIREKMLDTLNGLYTRLLDQQNIRYSDIIDSQIKESMYEIERYELSARTDRSREAAAILVLLGFMILLTIGLWIVINNSYDGLTQVLNRRQFDRNLDAIRKRKREYGIVMMDIDNFKKVNDVYGHPSGDEVLQRLGYILAKEESPYVQAYRYGGEEFALILKKEILGSAVSIAQRIRTTMEHEKWDFDPKKVITLSLGIAGGSGNDDVVSMADEKLYISKNSGKNCVTGEIKKYEH